MSFKLDNHRNLTHDSYSISSLKYSSSNLGNLQDDLPQKIAKKKQVTQSGVFHVWFNWVFGLGFKPGLDFLVPNLHAYHGTGT